MTVPEENRRKTDATDKPLETPVAGEPETPGASGRTLREAFEEARVEPDDFARE